MYSGTAKPEINRSRSLTLPVRVISPLEAYQLYSQGSPIDRMAGYYKKQGILNDDFFMMDQIGRLNALAEYKELTKQLDHQVKDLEVKVNEIKATERKAQQDAQYNAWKERFQAEQQVTK